MQEFLITAGWIIGLCLILLAGIIYTGWRIASWLTEPVEEEDTTDTVNADPNKVYWEDLSWLPEEGEEDNSGFDKLLDIRLKLPTGDELFAENCPYFTVDNYDTKTKTGDFTITHSSGKKRVWKDCTLVDWSISKGAYPDA
jgi:hypothetical protein